jgi:hypothetical protein
MPRIDHHDDPAAPPANSLVPAGYLPAPSVSLCSRHGSSDFGGSGLK